MEKKDLDEWEITKADYINRQMAVFKKYFGAKARECPDCGGPLWEMCEKNLRDMVSMTADAVMRSFRPKDFPIQTLQKEQKKC